VTTALLRRGPIRRERRFRAFSGEPDVEPQHCGSFFGIVGRMPGCGW
jgi:hypothetical protein